MRKKTLYLFVGLILMACTSTFSQTIQLRLPDTTVMAGDQFNVPIYADSILTGKGITSYMLQINFPSNYLKVVSVNASGTLSQTLATPVLNNSVAGQVTIACAGTTPLSGSGILLMVRFEALNPGYMAVSFNGTQNNYFNEGSPVLTLQNGYFTINAQPSINVYSNSNLISIGDSVYCYAYGGTGPYTFSVSNPAISSISSDGYLKAMHSGFTKAVAKDINGITDSTTSIEIRGLRLSMGDTSILQGSTIMLPVFLSNLDGLNINSGSFVLSYYTGVLSYLGVSATGTLISTASISVNESVPGHINISFANSTAFSSGGILIYLRFAVSSTQNGGSNLSLSNILFNENLLPVNTDGYFSTISYQTININPYNGTFFANDTVQFTATGGVPPYAWLVSDTSVASITSNGKLIAKQGGNLYVIVKDSVGYEAMTQNLQIFDAQVFVPNLTLPLDTIIRIPVQITGLPSGKSISSLGLNIGYDNSILTFVDIVNTSTLTDGWIMSDNGGNGQITYASSGVTGFSNAGTLFYIDFRPNAGFQTGQYTYINLSNVLLNEGKPMPQVNSGYITAGYPIPLQINIKKTPVPPVIDGKVTLNDPWTNSWIPLTRNKAGNSTSFINAGFQLFYNDSFLFFMTKVSGDQSVDTSSSRIPIPYENDNIELYLKMDTAIGNGNYMPGDWQFRMRRASVYPYNFEVWNDNNGDNPVFTSDSSFKIVQTGNDSVYYQEWQIPWRDLIQGMASKWNGKNLRFDMQVADNTTDSAGGRSQQIFWNSPSDEQWHNTNYFGFSILDTAVNVQKLYAVELVVQDLNKVYGDGPCNLTYTSNSQGAITWKIISGTAAVIDSITGTFTILGAGNVQVQAYQMAAAPYDSALDTATIMIAKALLNITADNQSKTYGDVNPAFTISYSGFVGADSAGMLDTLPVAGTTAGQFSDVGSYPINVSGGSDNYYDFNRVNGTLTINQAEQTITFEFLIPVQEGDPAFTVAPVASSGLPVTLSSSDPTVADNAGFQISVHTAGFTIFTASQSGNTNYLPAPDVARELKVLPKKGFNGRITGYVIDSLGIRIPEGKAYLFPIKGFAMAIPTDSTLLDTTGIFYFFGLDTGSYIVQFSPMANSVRRFIPTYSGNSATWENAVQLMITAADSAVLVTINAIELPPLNGDATISGSVEQSSKKSHGITATTEKLVGRPMKGASVVLVGKSTKGGPVVGNIVARTVTNDTGYYEFRNVPKGSYSIVVDIPGLPLVTYHTVEITTADSTITNMNYSAGKEAIVTGVLINSSEAEQLQLYPNPARGNISIVLTPLKEKSILTIIDMSGRVMYKAYVNANQSGRIELDISTLEASTYLITIRNSQQIIRGKFIKQ